MLVEKVQLLFWVGDRVPICGDGFACVGCVCVCVVEGTYETSKFGGICFV